jgi:hypothetical protein
MNITEFCYKHHACRTLRDGGEWALSLGIETMEELWMREDMKREWLIWIVTRPGVLTDRELRLFACWCVRQVWHLLADERSRNAVVIAERFANEGATKKELRAAYSAASAAYSAAAAAFPSASAYDAYAAAAYAAQTKYLIENTSPNFGGEQ